MPNEEHKFERSSNKVDYSDYLSLCPIFVFAMESRKMSSTKCGFSKMSLATAVAQVSFSFEKYLRIENKNDKPALQ